MLRFAVGRAGRGDLRFVPHGERASVLFEHLTRHRHERFLTSRVADRAADDDLVLFMCTGAILLYGIPRVVIGENRTFLGAEDLLRVNGVEVVNLDSPRCIELMTTFIAAHPTLWLEDIGQEDTGTVDE